jgi:methionyl-tRNA synthetase
VLAIVAEANRVIDRTRPWDLARAGAAAGADLDRVLSELVGACRTVADTLEPFLPDGAAGVRRRCTPADGRLPAPRPLFSRLEAAAGR